MKKYLLIIFLLTFFTGLTFAQVNENRIQELESKITELEKALNSIKIDYELLKSLSLKMSEKIDFLEKELKASKTIDSPTQESVEKTKDDKSKEKGQGFGQCKATTKKGSRCSRTYSDGSGYCWQHKK